MLKRLANRSWSALAATLLTIACAPISIAVEPSTSGPLTDAEFDVVTLADLPPFILNTAWSDTLGIIAVDPLVTPSLPNENGLLSPTVHRIDPKTGQTLRLRQQEKMAPKILSAKNIGGDLVYLEGNNTAAGGIARTVWLDDSLNKKSEVVLLGASENSDGLFIRYFYDWTVAGSTVVGYGIAHRSGNNVLGFFSQPLTLSGEISNAQPELIYTSEPPEYYLLDHPKLAAIDNTAYFLNMQPGSFPELFAMDTREAAGPKPVGIVPGSKKLPIFGMNQFSGGRLKDLHDFMASELTDISIGLYSDGRDLFILQHDSVMTVPGSAWHLRRVQVKGNQVKSQGVTHLPVTEPHLSITLSPTHWHLIPRGATQDNSGRQEIERLISIPHSAIR